MLVSIETLVGISVQRQRSACEQRGSSASPCRGSTLHLNSKDWCLQARGPSVSSLDAGKAPPLAQKAQDLRRKKATCRCLNATRSTRASGGCPSIVGTRSCVSRHTCRRVPVSHRQISGTQIGIMPSYDSYLEGP